MASLLAKSFAKINVGLRVLGRRPDGYHDIRTLLQTVSLFDPLRFEETSGDTIRLHCNVSSVPPDQTNLAYRAADLLKTRYRLRNGVTIQLNKVIPVGAGLGGGSSNAAVTLMALNELWSLRLSYDELMSLAKQIGSDVAFFLSGGTAWAIGRGDDIHAVDDINSYWVALVYPNIEVATWEAYERLDRTLSTRERSGTADDGDRLAVGPADLRATGNDFEALVFDWHPEIAGIKTRLLEQGAEAAQLSGSGSTVFGLFKEEIQARNALSRMNPSYRSFLVRFVNREEYRRSVIQPTR